MAFFSIIEIKGVGYARVSTKEQNLDRQLEMLINYGVDIRNIYKEKATGNKADRVELNRVIEKLQYGDVVVIADLYRVSMSTKDLLMIVDRIKGKGASIKSLKDTWLDTTASNPYNEFLLTVMDGMSQLERDLISSRTKKGLIDAKSRGRCGGRPSKRNEKCEIVQTLYKEEYKIIDIVKATNLSRTTIYRILNE